MRSANRPEMPHRLAQIYEGLIPLFKIKLDAVPIVSSVELVPELAAVRGAALKAAHFIAPTVPCLARAMVPEFAYRCFESADWALVPETSLPHKFLLKGNGTPMVGTPLVNLQN
jgi:hypothetical protein